MRRSLAMNMLAAALLFTLFASAAHPADEANLNERAKALLDSQFAMRGDRDGHVRFNIMQVRELRGTPLAELALRQALANDPAMLSAANVGEAEVRKLMAEETDLQPELLDLARRYLARSMMWSGRRDEALALHRQRGLAMTWRVSGPYPAGVAVTDDAEDEPTAFDPSVSAPVAEDFRKWRRNPPWRDIPEEQAFPFVYPWRWAATVPDGPARLRTGLYLEAADSKAEFSVISGLSWRLYVDDVLVAAVDRTNAQLPREHIVAQPLSSGWHMVELECAPPPAEADAEGMGVAVRINTSVSYAWNRDVGEYIQTSEIGRREAQPPRYLSELAGLADKTASAPLREAYAAACAEQGLDDEAAWQAGEAAKLDSASVFCRVRTGQYMFVNSQLPVERRGDNAFEWFKSSLDMNPDLVPALLFLAERAAGAGRRDEAGTYLRRAHEVNPRSLDVLMARGRWAERFGSSAMARQAWSECAKAFPSSAAALKAAAAAAAAQMDMESREAYCRAAVEAGDAGPGAMLALAEALADSGNDREAASTVREMLAAFPKSVSTLVAAGDIYSRIGDREAAMTVLSEALALRPDSAELWRNLGDKAKAAGKDDLALKYWRVSLAADPSQHSLAEMAAVLEGRGGRAVDDGGYDVSAMLFAQEGIERSGDAVRLLDRAVIEINADGSYSRLTHDIDMALSRRGGEALSRVESAGELIRARTVLPSGASLELEPVPGGDSLRLPVLPPGAARETMAIEFRAAQNGVPPTIGTWYFQDPLGKRAFLLSEFVVRAPRGYPLVYVCRDVGEGVEFEKTVDGDRDVYRWTATMGPPPREPDAVHISERLPSVDIGLGDSWYDISRRELKRFDGRLIPSRRIRFYIADITKNLSSSSPKPDTLAEALYRYVLDTVDPAPTPGSAAQILANRMGDRNVLLLALLRASGFNAHPGAARPGRDRMHDPVWEIPSRNTFTIPLVRLTLPDGRVVWLDTRYDFLTFGGVAEDLSEATVMAFTPDGPLFETLPRLAPSELTLAEERRLALPATADKGVAVSGRTSVKGVAGLVRRQFLADADADARAKAILESLYPVFPDAALDKLDIYRAEIGGDFLVERYELTSRVILEKRPGGLLSVPLCMPPPNLVSEASRNMPKRATTCHIRTEMVAEDRNQFILPAGARIVRLPEAVSIPSRFGIYQLRVSKTSPELAEIRRSYRIPPQRIEPWEWDDFLKFLDAIDLAERQWLEYEPANAPSEQ